MTKKDLIKALENILDDALIEIMFGINHYKISSYIKFTDAVLLRSEELDEIFDESDDYDEEDCESKDLGWLKNSY